MKKISFWSVIWITIFSLLACQKDDLSRTSNEIRIYPEEMITLRESGTWNVNLANFRYVWQNRVPIGWKNHANYGVYPNACSYPQYSGAYQFTEGSNTNLCGIASYMMGANLVNHPALMDVPYGVNDRAIRLVEYAKRYHIFDANYGFGYFCRLANIGSMGNGTSTKKGDFTNWSYCSQYTYPGTSWGGSSDREAVKAFIKSKISNGKPCVALIRIKPSVGCNDANCGTYISTNHSIGTGHMVLITGLTWNESTGIHKIRFKDPWPNNSQTYEILYSTFLNSMWSASEIGVYNVLSINGNQ